MDVHNLSKICVACFLLCTKIYKYLFVFFSVFEEHRGRLKRDRSKRPTLSSGLPAEFGVIGSLFFLDAEERGSVPGSSCFRKPFPPIPSQSFNWVGPFLLTQIDSSFNVFLSVFVKCFIFSLILRRYVNPTVIVIVGCT